MAFCELCEQVLHCHTWLDKAVKGISIWHLHPDQAKTSRANRGRTVRFIKRWFWFVRLASQTSSTTRHFLSSSPSSMSCYPQLRWDNCCHKVRCQFRPHKEVAAKMEARVDNSLFGLAARSSDKRRTLTHCDW